MKVALVHNYFLAGDRTEQKVMRPYPPLGLLYLSAYLENNGIDNQVFDGTFASQDRLIQFLESAKPDYIGFYVNFLLRQKVLKTIDHIRRNLPDSTIILGGPDVKYHAENYLAYGADYLVIGEGEQSFYDLVIHLEQGNDIDDIAGIVFTRDKKTVVNPSRDLIADLDTLPFPNRRKIDIKRYLDVWKSRHGYSSITISTQRGCPFTCKWCSHAVYGDTYRRRSPGSVVAEIKSIDQVYHPDRYWFVDDVFTMSKKWLDEFCSELKKEKISIAYECITRADRVDEETIRLLSDSGCKLVWIGAESGSQKVLDLMDRRVDIMQVRNTMSLAKKHGIKTGTFIMLGYPGETEEDILETIGHLKACDPDYFTINKAYPIKGTKLYEIVEDCLAEKYQWHSSPDNEVDFKRTYKSRYYDFAIRKISNEVWSYKYRQAGNYLAAFKCRVKSALSSLGMKITK